MNLHLFLVSLINLHLLFPWWFLIFSCISDESLSFLVSQMIFQLFLFPWRIFIFSCVSDEWVKAERASSICLSLPIFAPLITSSHNVPLLSKSLFMWSYFTSIELIILFSENYVQIHHQLLPEPLIQWIPCWLLIFKVLIGFLSYLGGSHPNKQSPTWALPISHDLIRKTWMG